MNSQNNSTFHLAMNAEHSVFFHYKGCRLLFKLKPPSFPLRSLQQDLPSAPTSPSLSADPKHKGPLLPSLLRGDVRISGSAPGPFLKHRNTHISMGLVGDKLLLVKWCDVGVSFLKEGCCGKKHHS